MTGTDVREDVAKEETHLDEMNMVCHTQQHSQVKDCSMVLFHQLYIQPTGTQAENYGQSHQHRKQLFHATQIAFLTGVATPLAAYAAYIQRPLLFMGEKASSTVQCHFNLSDMLMK